MTDVLSEDEIDQILSAINAGETKPEDFRPSSETRKIKIYDFKRPDKFSMDQLRNISIMHENFARLITGSISAKCRAMSHAHLASVDQLTYEEFLRSIPMPTTLAVISMRPIAGNVVLEIDPAITFAALDRILGGCGEKVENRHELTDIEESIIKGVILKLIDNLREAWQPVLDLQPELAKIETNPQFAQIVPPGEMVVLITLECKIDDTEGMINLCVPFLTVEPVLGRFSNQNYYKSKKSGAKKVDTGNFDDMRKTIRAEYFRKEVTVEQLISLLELKETIIIDDRPPFTGKLYVDDICAGEFSAEADGGSKTKSGHIKIKILKKKLKSEKNYMEEKNNVLEKEGVLKDIKVQLIVELGRTNRSLSEVSEIDEGTIIQLDKLAGEPVDLYANNVKIGLGEVVVIDESFGIRVTGIVKEEKF